MIDYVTDWLIGLYVHVLLCVCFRHALISLRDKQGAHVALSPTMPANTPTWVLRTLHVVITLFAWKSPSVFGRSLPSSVDLLSFTVRLCICLWCLSPLRAIFFLFFFALPWRKLVAAQTVFFFLFFFSLPRSETPDARIGGYISLLRIQLPKVLSLNPLRRGDLRLQILKYHLMRTESLKVLS